MICSQRGISTAASPSVRKKNRDGAAFSRRVTTTAELTPTAAPIVPTAMSLIAVRREKPSVAPSFDSDWSLMAGLRRLGVSNGIHGKGGGARAPRGHLRAILGSSAPFGPAYLAFV